METGTYICKLPWMFAYDRPNYARFLTYYRVTMQKLPETHPAIHEEFMAGNFSVRRQHGIFNKIPSDQAIEQTINRDQKCAGGIINFCTMEGTIQRWVLTSHIAAKCKSKMELFLGMTELHNITKDVSKERMALDEECVVRSYELVKQWGSPFTENFYSIRKYTLCELDMIQNKKLKYFSSMGQYNWREYSNLNIRLSYTT